VRVDVPGGHARHPEPPGEPGQRPVERPVVALEGPLQLDPEVIGPEGLEQPAQGRFVMHPALRAAAQAHEARGVLEDELERDGRGPGHPAERAA